MKFDAIIKCFIKPHRSWRETAWPNFRNYWTFSRTSSRFWRPWNNCSSRTIRNLHRKKYTRELEGWLKPLCATATRKCRGWYLIILTLSLASRRKNNKLLRACWDWTSSNFWPVVCLKLHDETCCMVLCQNSKVINHVKS